MRYYNPLSLLKSILFIGCFMGFIACSTTPEIETDLATEDIIPIPVSVNATGKAFVLSQATRIAVAGENEVALGVGKFLANKLKPSTGFATEVFSSDNTDENNVIHLEIKPDEELGDEGYHLAINPDNIVLSANKAAGLFYGAQTILQLLPSDVFKSTKQEGPWIIPTGEIVDFPEYSYRGAMLDVSRHFFGMEVVKQYIDYLAFYKLNVLHLHLSDDQGWRIEIKSWPNLTNHGGKTEVGGGEGGFFTQEQYSEIVKYAQQNFMTIIPEIDMPGHTNAALSSYPELNCNEKAPDLYTGIEVGFSTFCTDKEVTYQFIDDVVRELAQITPGPYIHIGGDESHATSKEDYIPFINKVQDIVTAHGKQMIGWDEVATASLNQSAIAQFWASEENAKLAVEQNVKVIVSPATKTYLDMQYDSTTRIGLHWAAYIEIDSSYNWDPTTLDPSIKRENILGVESPLWTETIENMDDIEYMAFPRLIGHAEIGWSPQNRRNWEDYQVRLAKHAAILQAKDINFYKSDQIAWPE